MKKIIGLLIIFSLTLCPISALAQDELGEDTFNSQYAGILDSIDGFSDEEIHQSINNYLAQHPNLRADIKQMYETIDVKSYNNVESVLEPKLVGQKIVYQNNGTHLLEKKVLLYDSGVYAILKLTGQEEANPIALQSTHYKMGTAVKTLYYLGSITGETNKNVPIAKMRLVSRFGYNGRTVWATSIDGQNQLLVSNYREAWKSIDSEYTDGNRNVFRTINYSGFQGTTGGMLGKMIIERYELRLSCNMQGRLFTNGDALS